MVKSQGREDPGAFSRIAIQHGLMFSPELSAEIRKLIASTRFIAFQRGKGIAYGLYFAADQIFNQKKCQFF